MRLASAAPYPLAALIVIAPAYLGLTAALGAHPFWSVSVAWLGVPLGLLLAVLARATGAGGPLRVLIFAIGLGLAFVVATVGKERFAASYAEDAFAGRMWYFGWIATAAFAAALLAAALSHARSRA